MKGGFKTLKNVIYLSQNGFILVNLVYSFHEIPFLPLPRSKHRRFRKQRFRDDGSETFMDSFTSVKNGNLGCHHSSVDLSAPTILLPRVRVPSTQSTILLFTVIVLYLSCKRKKINKKRSGLAHF